MEAGAKAPVFLIRKGNQNTSAVRPVPLPVPALQAEWHPSAIAVSMPLCAGVCANPAMLGAGRWGRSILVLDKGRWSLSRLLPSHRPAMRVGADGQGGRFGTLLAVAGGRKTSLRRKNTQIRPFSRWL